MTIEKKKITAVIVTYRSRDTIGATLDALYPAYERGICACVVVDNASTDGTADFVAREYPWASLVRSSENLGFGRGCNRGFEEVESPYLLLLNPDAQIDVNALSTLLEFIESHPKAGIVAPATIAGNGDSQDAGMVLTPGGLVRSALGRGGVFPDRRTITRGAPPFRTTWVCGAIMLIRSDMFRKLRGFDPRFFLYFEETDLCLRALAEGMEIWVLGEATATHLVGASAQKTGEKLSWGTTGNIVEHYYPSRFYYLKKHFGWLSAIFAEFVAAAVDWMRWCRMWAKKSADRRAQRRLIERPFFRFPARTRDQS